jgi:hypothetical protein
VLPKKSRIFWELRPGGTDIWKGMDIVLPGHSDTYVPCKNRENIRRNGKNGI